jgi:hypothetical protein
MLTNVELGGEKSKSSKEFQSLLHITHYFTLIEDEQRGFGVFLQFCFASAGPLGGGQRVDHINGTGKEYGVALETGRIAQGGRQVGFTVLMTMPSWG